MKNDRWRSRQLRSGEAERLRRGNDGDDEDNNGNGDGCLTTSLASSASLGCRIARASMESRRLGGGIVHIIAAGTAALHITATKAACL
ncbi:MAG: hypothetical protein IKR48_06400 [Kiritimatiellae bacterium]|nr:hypothetical protein [Kiritimatiellia bacterium]